MLVAVLTIGLLIGTGTGRGPGTPTPGTGSATTPLPVVALLPPVLLAPTGPPPAPGVLATRLAPVLRHGPLARDVAATVVDARTGALLWDYRGAVPQIPASTAKLLTAAAALEALGPQHRLVTRTVVDPTGRVVLVGGGDLTLTAAASPQGSAPATSLRALAAATAAAVRTAGLDVVTVGVDASQFTGPAVSPAWEHDYVSSGIVAPVSALAVDAARIPGAGVGDAHPLEVGAQRRYADPALAAGSVFASMLTQQGLTVLGRPQRARPGADATELARVNSAPLSALVAHTLTTSDNDGAEALLRLVGQAQRHDPSFQGGVAGVRDVLDRLGVPVTGLRLLDGSGLARGNLVSSQTLAALLALAADDAYPELRSLVTGLPVAGLTGTLADRFAGSAAGVVRAKTGSLSGVSALTGLVVDADGALVAFAVLADQVPLSATVQARDRLDLLAIRLAQCGCLLPTSAASRSVGT